MSVYSTEYHAMMPSPSPAPENVTSTAPKTGDQDESFFHHMLDVVNPLQHLPVIGTIYRAITGEHIGPVEKIAGDALYGGLWGAVSSIADVALEQITGKSAEDTVLGWLKGSSDTEVAKITAPNITVAQSLPSSDTPALPSAPTAIASAQPNGADVTALTASLAAKGIIGDAASRAIDAYRRAIGTPMTPPVFASLN
jgi:hypothetical protein